MKSLGEEDGKVSAISYDFLVVIHPSYNAGGVLGFFCCLLTGTCFTNDHKMLRRS